MDEWELYLDVMLRVERLATILNVSNLSGENIYSLNALIDKELRRIMPPITIGRDDDISKLYMTKEDYESWLEFKVDAKQGDVFHYNPKK